MWSINYGNIFSIWDRLLGTFATFDRDKIVYGVDVFPDEKKNNKIGSLLKQPFEKYQKPTKGQTDWLNFSKVETIDEIECFDWSPVLIFFKFFEAW